MFLLSKERAEILSKLVKAGVVHKSFIGAIKSGDMNPNCWRGPRFSDCIEPIAGFMVEDLQKKNIQFDCIIGIPSGGTEYAKHVHAKTKAPLLEISKDDFKQEKFVEMFQSYSKCDGGLVRVLIVDDVFYTGGTVLPLITWLKSQGMEIAAIAVPVQLISVKVYNLAAQQTLIAVYK